MQGAVSVSAAGWAAVATGVLALVASILLWRTRAELRRARAAKRPTGQSQWRTPIPPSDASHEHRAAGGEPAASSPTTAPAAAAAADDDDAAADDAAPDAADAKSGAATAPAGEEGKLQSTEVARVDHPEEPERLDLLLELLEDEEPDTRRDAVTALAGIRSPQGAVRLSLVLAQDPSAAVRREAVAALRDSLERPRASAGGQQEPWILP